MCRLIPVACLHSQVQSRWLSQIKLMFMKKMILKQRESANITPDCPVGKQHVEDFSATSFIFSCASKKNGSMLLLSASVYWLKKQFRNKFKGKIQSINKMLQTMLGDR